MLRPLGNRAARSLCSRCRPLALNLQTTALAHHDRRGLRRLQTSAASADRVPLRKQLKQEAKALKTQKKQRRELEEASRQKWELTVGVEIHAQLDTEAKLFSSECFRGPAGSTRPGHLLTANRGGDVDERCT